MQTDFINCCSKYNGERSIILILDSGVPKNEELTNNILYDKNINFFDSKYIDKLFFNQEYLYNNKSYQYINEDINDNFGHQTNLISIISSNYLGISIKSKIICGKILNKHGKAPLSVILKSLRYANIINPDIINISIGYFLKDITDLNDIKLHKEIEKEVKTLYNKNIIVICSKKNSQDFYPADFDYVISVMECKENENNKIKTDFRYSKIKFLVNTIQDNLSIKSGSSLMTAFISGLLSNYITFLKLENKEINAKEIKKLLIKNSDNICRLYSPSIILAQMPINEINNLLKEIIND